MTAPCFEDFAPGQVFGSDPLAVTEEVIVGFARVYDAQPFHLDAKAAEGTFAGRLIASGWHTASLGMRLLQGSGFRGGSSMGSPGITELRWLKPVLPGDALHLAVRVEDCRRSGSRPDRGFVRFAMSVLNQRGETAMTQAFTVIFPRRGAEPLPPRPVAPAGEAAGPVEEDVPPQVLAPLGAIPVGFRRELGSYRFTAPDIVGFASAFDPQVFHLDAEAARLTHFGGLCASGWQTVSVWMRRHLATHARDAALTRAQGLPVPEIGPSPGFKDLRWLAPVYAGDTIRFATELTDKRESASRPGWGLAFSRNTGVNQHGATVLAFQGSVFCAWA